MNRVIVTAEDWFEEQTAIASAKCVRMHPPIAEHQTAEVVAQAEVNHGRWVVRCPLHVEDGSPCGGAQFAHREDRRFWCVACQNAEVASAWLEVEWPDEAEEIEEILLERTMGKNRNWVPGEPLAALREENAA